MRAPHSNMTQKAHFLSCRNGPTILLNSSYAVLTILARLIQFIEADRLMTSGKPQFQPRIESWFVLDSSSHIRH
jgi:hypothetical protein